MTQTMKPNPINESQQSASFDPPSSIDTNPHPQIPCLYYYPGTRAFKVRWMLEELAIHYELITVDLPQGAHKQNAHRRIHPLGKVPALVLGEQTLFESSAICLYLADHFSAGQLAPALGAAERGAYYQWVAFATTTLEPAIIEQLRLRKAEEAGSEVISMGPVLTPFADVMDWLERDCAHREANNRPYLLGGGFTTADLMLASTLIWADKQQLLTDCPAVCRWLDRMRKRHAFVCANRLPE